MSTGEPPLGGQPGRQGPGPGDAHRSRANDIFYSLGDAEKVKFTEEELPAVLARIDKLLTDLEQLGVGVEDDEGLVSLTFGFDGQLVDIALADAIGHVMTNLELEKRLNKLFADGTGGVAEMRPAP